MIRKLIVLVACVLGGGLSGCGNLTYPNTYVISPNQTRAHLSPDASLFADYDCSLSDQIIPRLNAGVSSYSVCISKTSALDVLLIPSVNYSPGNICVLPGWASSTSSDQFMKDQNKNDYLVLCSSVSEGSLPNASFTFTGKITGVNGFNTLLVVDEPHLDQMLKCIPNGMVDCPDYSFGQFR